MPVVRQLNVVNVFLSVNGNPVDKKKNISTLNPMKTSDRRPRGRPAKDPSERKVQDLRIPVTAEQKKIIADATREEPDGMAAWARAVLLREARKRLAKSDAK